MKKQKNDEIILEHAQELSDDIYHLVEGETSNVYLACLSLSKTIVRMTNEGYKSLKNPTKSKEQVKKDMIDLLTQCFEE